MKSSRTTKGSHHSNSLSLNNFFHFNLQQNRYANKPSRQQAHRRVVSTRDERSLQNHEAYKHAWSNQMKLSIRVRDALQGKVNQS